MENKSLILVSDSSFSDISFLPRVRCALGWRCYRFPYITYTIYTSRRLSCMSAKVVFLPPSLFPYWPALAITPITPSFSHSNRLLRVLRLRFHLREDSKTKRQRFRLRQRSGHRLNVSGYLSEIQYRARL